jgi:hypothetical protein
MPDSMIILQIEIHEKYDGQYDYTPNWNPWEVRWTVWLYSKLKFMKRTMATMIILQIEIREKYDGQYDYTPNWNSWEVL